MDKRLEEQLGRTARYIVDQLRELNKKYYDIVYRRSKDNAKKYHWMSLNTPRPKGCHVIAPSTPWTRRQAVIVLHGDFDRAVKLVKRLKKIQQDSSHISMRVEDRPITNLGEIMRAYLDQRRAW